MPIYQPDNKPFDGPHVLDNPPPLHEKLCAYGERPYWSPDGKRIAFIDRNYGDVCEMDFATRKVRNLTKDLGDHHSFLRVLFLANGDYLLIGPKVFKDRHTSRHLEAELWIMDRQPARRIMQPRAVNRTTPAQDAFQPVAVVRRHGNAARLH